MEDFPYSELYDANPVQQRRIDELMQHAYLITLHEQLAEAWERSAVAAPVSAESATRRAEISALYEQDLGVRPDRRHELERHIEEAIADRRGETLAEIIETVRGQSQNPSSVSLD